MVLGYVQKTIAERIGVNRPKDISLDFSFVDNDLIDEEEFYEMLEEIEVEMQLELIDHAWKFETVRHLVEFISSND